MSRFRRPGVLKDLLACLMLMALLVGVAEGALHRTHLHVGSPAAGSEDTSRQVEPLGDEADQQDSRTAACQHCTHGPSDSGQPLAPNAAAPAASPYVAITTDFPREPGRTGPPTRPPI